MVIEHKNTEQIFTYMLHIAGFSGEMNLSEYFLTRLMFFAALECSWGTGFWSHLAPLGLCILLLQINAL